MDESNITHCIASYHQSCGLSDWGLYSADGLLQLDAGLVVVLSHVVNVLGGESVREIWGFVSLVVLVGIFFSSIISYCIVWQIFFHKIHHEKPNVFH